MALPFPAAAEAIPELPGAPFAPPVTDISDVPADFVRSLPWCKAFSRRETAERFPDFPITC
jgi:hypothetical protein